VEKAYGIHAVEAILQQQSIRVTAVWVQAHPNKRQQALLTLVKSHHQAPVHWVQSAEWDALAPQARHQGIMIAYTRQALAQPDLLDLVQSRLPRAVILILDGVVDPSNLGACIRSAAAFSVDAVIIPKDKAVQVNETVRKVAAGGAERIPVYSVTNLARTMEQLAELGMWFYGFTEHTDTLISQVSFSGGVGIVMGSEANGLRELTMRRCDHLIKLPTSDAFSTLNVSVATGIALYEVSKQMGL
jgi:23S rRNA (guanosine2251-2'-O)-methyltransferase